MENANIKAYWQTFLERSGEAASTTYRECFYFGYNEELATVLLALVLSGQKTATSSALPAYAHESAPLPKAGDYCLITDWQGTPRCVIQTTKVTVLPFREMTFNLCRLEGEDATLASWKANHETAFRACEAEDGYTFSADMEVVFEEFAVVYRE